MMGALVWVNTYHVTRHYGGPEEGGWWYDRGEPVGSTRCKTPEAAQALRDELMATVLHNRGPGYRGRGSVAPTAPFDVEVYLDDRPGAAFPTERPVYE